MEQGLFLPATANLDAAMPVFDTADVAYLPVVEQSGDALEIIGALYHVDALKAYNRALAATAAEEHS
jgi:CIC family chloride channel protein